MEPRTVRRMRVSAFIALASLGVVFSGCGLLPNRESGAQEAASDMNMNARFGRSQLVMQHIAEKERAEFDRTHRQWGGEIRVTDAEITGLHLEADGEARVTVRAAWFRLSEGELRTTVLRQKWKQIKGSWLLVAEERVEGDVGLLGEPIVQAPGAPEMVQGPAAQFPTVRLGEND
jgi:hypothetical protein